MSSAQMNPGKVVWSNGRRFKLTIQEAYDYGDYTRRGYLACVRVLDETDRTLLFGDPWERPLREASKIGCATIVEIFEQHTPGSATEESVGGGGEHKGLVRRTASRSDWPGGILSETPTGSDTGIAAIVHFANREGGWMRRFADPGATGLIS